ncbi:MAG: DUF5696 domain-containing protein [Defluviitaleaceae bacterium]|nr:DUF5696 domain-containing protein [Defluviitaleaceae bacterium]
MKKCLGLLLLALFALTACVARERDAGELVQHRQSPDAPPYLTIQNDVLRLDFLTATAEIVVTELATGNTWRSTPETGADYAETAAIERFYMQSLLLMEYQNRASSTWTDDTYRFAVRNQSFTQAIVDGGIEVYFTIGDIPQIFHIPDAIYAERMRPLIAEMSRLDGLQVQSIYRPISLETLRAGDDRGALVERFPTLEDGRTIYVLHEDAQPFLQAMVETMLYEAGYTYEDWLYDQMHFNVPTEFNRAMFNVTMRFELDDNAMKVTIPFDEIAYHPTFMPTHLTIMPYFGAARATDEGYMFVPDGSGALLFHDSGRFNQNTFASRVYGWDEAIIRSILIRDNRSPYPVFGIYTNGATFAAIIEEGAAYAMIQAEVAGMRAPFNRVHPTFRMLHGTTLDVAGRSDTQLMMHEWELPAGERIMIRYVFTETPGYVGMAHAYRDFLQARYPWLNERVQQPVHAMVEILGAALTPQHFLGFPVDRPMALTTFDQAGDMMQALSDLGWENLHIKMRGAHNRSIDHRVPTSFDLVSQLGNRRAFDRLVETAGDLGHTFYLEADFVFMRGNSWFNGFSPSRDAARQANRQRAEHTGFSPTYFGPLGAGSVLADPVIIARPQFTINTAQNFVSEISNAGVNNIAFRSMAAALSGDFHEDRHVSREAAMNMRTDMLYDMRHDGTGIWLNYGFAFAAPFADVITRMPMDDQGFGITDMSVPFFQIALHGLIPFAGDALNLAEDYSHHLLRSIEGGASLFFSFMDVPTSDLQVTRYLRYFANEFDLWVAVANDLYQSHVTNFGHLYNQFIVDHQILDRRGVTVTIYEDGTRVYVNSSLIDFNEGGVSIPAQRYVVVRGAGA